MKCPYCTVEVHEGFTSIESGINGPGYQMGIGKMKCPSCKEWIIRTYEQKNGTSVVKQIILRPKFASRPISKQIPDEIRNDFNEAAATLEVSPKASAALSRYLMQMILREKAEIHVYDEEQKKVVKKPIKQGRLIDEIDQVVENGNLNSNLVDGLSTIRKVGNYGAHPEKSKVTNEIIEVEPGEAEWLLDILELLIDYYYLLPAQHQQRKEQLNSKLEALGKEGI